MLTTTSLVVGCSPRWKSFGPSYPSPQRCGGGSRAPIDLTMPDYALAGLKQPIKYHPRDAFDWTRPGADFIGHDDAGRFVAIYLVVIASLMEGTQIHRDMKGFPVRLAYVIDNTVGRDEQLDFAKCDYISYAMISALPDEPEPSAAGG